MLKSLDYSVVFPTTGRSFENRIEFAPGLTAITGRNEAGKTLNFEMISYCLFGKAALRGLASDYKNLAATLNFEVAGKDVLIQRAKKETMTVDGEIVAVGAEAINKAVPALLGFGLDVFHIACAAQQGDLDALTKMKPTERRAMIDRLIGIDVLENIEKECRSEAKTAETVAASLVLSMSEPVAPEQPEDYEPSAVLEERLVQVRAHEAERLRLSQIPEPTAPVPPEAPAETDIAMLEAQEMGRRDALERKARLEGQLAGIPEVTCSREDLARALAYKEYQDEVRRRGPRPDYTLDQLRHFKAIMDAKASAGEEATCPKCDYHFHIGLTPELEELAAQECPIKGSDWHANMRRHELWAEPLDEVEPFELPNIQQEILAHARADDRTAILNQLGELVLPADRSGELRAARVYQQALAVYGERAARYDAELDAFRDARSRLEGMADLSGELGALHGRVAGARAFEGQLDRYAADLERYNKLRLDCEQHRLRGDNFKRGADSLKGARVRVKQELAPDLSRAASTLLSAMTSGGRRSIVVDEDFNILVDGQPLQTLSGSGKSVVNLALRIGLGQVLTSKVLPIFLGDEIDKDMDGERAAATHETMQNLRQYLTQIIIVTHKPDFEADNLVSLSA